MDGKQSMELERTVIYSPCALKYSRTIGIIAFKAIENQPRQSVCEFAVLILIYHDSDTYSFLGIEAQSR